jgi:hypothetical protein
MKLAMKESISFALWQKALQEQAEQDLKLAIKVSMEKIQEDEKLEKEEEDNMELALRKSFFTFDEESAKADHDARQIEWELAEFPSPDRGEGSWSKFAREKECSTSKKGKEAIMDIASNESEEDGCL